MVYIQNSWSGGSEYAVKSLPDSERSRMGGERGDKRKQGPSFEKRTRRARGESRVEDTASGTDIRRCAEKQSGIRSARYGTWRRVSNGEGRETGYRNRKRVKKRGDGKYSLETLSTLHADGHRFGKTKWRAR